MSGCAAWILLVFVGAPTIIDNVRVEVGDGTVLINKSVIIDRGRIVSVGAARPDLKGTRIDGTGKTLTPGFVETISEIGLVEIGLVEPTADARLDGGPLLPGFRAADGFNPATVQIPIIRAQGVTSAIVGPSGQVIFGTGAWVDLTGTTESRPDPDKPAAMFGGVGERASSSAGGARGGVWLLLRQLIEDSRFYLRSRPSFDRGQARALIVSPLHLQAMIPVLLGRLPLVLEANRASDILAAVEFAASARIRLIIAGGAEAWQVADRLAKTRTPVILRPSVQSPHAFETLGARDDSAAILDRASVPLVLTAGGFAGRLRQEAGIAVAYGLGHEAAIRAITQTPAQLFGRDRELGTVAPRKRANLVLWSGDPLEVTTVAERVWIDGVEQSLDTRQKKLVERYLK